ncbi:GcrA family cell cycle regulator [Agrobacterium sp. rho-13.3]|uniref:GcrA family cell cycle regulator n=1 Tax=Agrobacterium sp. rho-13.3 TaxID=3072980 RepID=UPI003D7A0473
MPDRSIIFGTKTNVCQIVYDRLSELTDYPFLILQIARRVRSSECVRDALGHDDVRDAVVQDWITLRPNEPRFVWTEANEKRLSDLFHGGHSLSKIAKALGVSRNAVASKVKRKDFNVRTFWGQQADLFAGTISGGRKAVPDPSMELEHYTPKRKFPKSSYSPPPNMNYVSTEENRSSSIKSAPKPKK